MEETKIENNIIEDASEMVTDAEQQLKFHRSEKETFSKGIASIIYKGLDNEQVESGECQSEEKNVAIEEIIQLSETKILERCDNSDTTSHENISKEEIRTEESKMNLSNNNGNVKTETAKPKQPVKKGFNRMSKSGSRFTVIAGQKVDLNSDKPQYLKLTIEEIQQLAFQQRSEKLRIDDEAEHYCALHSPPRRRKVLQDKVKNGQEKLNSLKRIEKNVEDGIKTPTLSPRISSMNPSTRLSRSPSLKISSSSTKKSSVKLMSGVHASESSKVTNQNQHQMKKVTFKPNLETSKTTHDKVELAIESGTQRGKTASSVLQRSSSLPRYLFVSATSDH